MRFGLRVSLRQYWQLLAEYLKPQRQRTVLLGFLLLCSIGLQLAAPQILARFIDRALDGDSLNSLLILAGFFLAVALVGQAINLAEVWVAENLGWTATNNLRNDLALHILNLDRSFHNTYTPGALIERVDGDIGKLANFFSRFVVQILGNGLLALGVIVLLFGVDWRVGLAMAGFAAFTIVAILTLRGFALPLWAREREASARLFGFIEERLAGTEDIRSAGATAYVMRENYRFSRENTIRHLKAAIVGSFTANISIFFFAVGTAISLGFAVWLFNRGEITIGTAYLIYQYNTILSNPIQQITRQMQDLQQAGASVGRIQELLDIQSEIPDGQGSGTQTGTALAVEFEGVSFGYGDDDPVLQDVSFHLAPGKVLGLIGRTGSGKTTITRLLLRLHDPTAGAVRIGGEDVRTFKLADLRERIGVVTQDIQLFHATVRDNLTFFDPNANDAHILAILQDLGLSRWLERLPNGLDSMLAAGGSGLSAGEAQLLAFARVFLHDPQIVLLDEASSRLDPVTEARLEYAIDRLLTDRTGIVIAHRLATVQRADEIMVLANGEILEHGTQQALLSNPNSRFSQMLRSGQALTDDDEDSHELGREPDPSEPEPPSTTPRSPGSTNPGTSSRAYDEAEPDPAPVEGEQS